MILSDRDIRTNLQNGKIVINPTPNLDQVLGSCSIDFHLGNTFKIFNHSKYPYIDPRSPNLSSEIMKEITISKEEAFIMRPGEFCLATTVEHLKIDNDLLGRLEGRSSLGRIGIIVHSTAARFDPGWDGTPVLELGNIGVLPVALYPGMKICSFTFEELSSPSENPYSKRKDAKYINQKKPEASRISQELGNQETRYIKHGKKSIKVKN
jgi:dCTP deaminase